MTKSQIGIGCVGLLAAGLFLAGLFLPIAVVGFPNGAAGIALWESTWCRATLLVFLALVALPLVKPGSHAWVLSFLAAAALIAMASGGLLKHWFGADSLIPITLLVLLSAGICLAAEAILARRSGRARPTTVRELRGLDTHRSPTTPRANDRR